MSDLMNSSDLAASSSGAVTDSADEFDVAKPSSTGFFSVEGLGQVHDISQNNIEMEVRKQPSTKSNASGKWSVSYCVDDTFGDFTFMGVWPFPENIRPPPSRLAIKRLRLQRKVFDFFVKPVTWIRVAYQLITMTILLCFVCIGIVSTLPSVHINEIITFTFQLLLTVIYLVEYSLKLWSCVSDPSYYRHGFWGRLKFVLSFWMLIEIITIIAGIVSIGISAARDVLATQNKTFTGNGGLINVIRLLRLLYLLKVFSAVKQRRDPLELLYEIWVEYRYSFFISSVLNVIIVVVCACVIYFIEGPDRAPVTNIDSIPSAIYWAVITLSTIGYGNQNVETALGQFFNILMAWFGIAFFAIPAGLLSSSFALKIENADAEDQKKNRNQHLAINTIIFWWRYRSLRARSPGSSRTIKVFMDNFRQLRLEEGMKLLELNKKKAQAQQLLKKNNDSIEKKDSLPFTESEKEILSGEHSTGGYKTALSGEDTVRNLQEVNFKLYTKLQDFALGKTTVVPTCMYITFLMVYKMGYIHARKSFGDSVSNQEPNVADVMFATCDLRYEMRGSLLDLKAYTAEKRVRDLQYIFKHFHKVEKKAIENEQKLDQILELLQKMQK